MAIFVEEGSVLKVEAQPQLPSLFVFSFVFFPPRFPQLGKLVPSVAPPRSLLKGGGAGGDAGVGALGA